MEYKFKVKKFSIGDKIASNFSYINEGGIIYPKLESIFFGEQVQISKDIKKIDAMLEYEIEYGYAKKVKHKREFKYSIKGYFDAATGKIQYNSFNLA